MNPRAFVAALAAATMLAGSPASWAGQLEFIERVVGGRVESRAGTPAAPDSTAALLAQQPIVIAVHGLGDRPESFIRLFDELEVPTRVIVPRAPVVWGAGFSWFPLPGTDQASHEAFVAGLRESAKSLAELAAMLARERPSRPPPVIVGFSQGGMLSFAVAALYPQAISVSMPVAGLLPDAVAPRTSPDPDAHEPSSGAVKLPHVIAFHGDADGRVPVARAALAVERMRAAGYDARIRRYPGVGHSIPAAMRDDLLAAIAAAIREKPLAPGRIRAGGE
ncbi:MAG: hypothetical protein E4H03_00405 [Myxococcales bacterium]|nr:MAG: hypothetical protein E4H03_00405 [Myxococcales bacterium]